MEVYYGVKQFCQTVKGKADTKSPAWLKCKKIQPKKPKYPSIKQAAPLFYCVP